MLAFNVGDVGFTWVRDKHLVDEVDDAVGGNDVLLQHHFDAVDCQTVAIATDLYGAALCCLVHWPCHDCFWTLDTVQQVVVHQCWVGGSNERRRGLEKVADLNTPVSCSYFCNQVTQSRVYSCSHYSIHIAYGQSWILFKLFEKYLGTSVSSRILDYISDWVQLSNKTSKNWPVKATRWQHEKLFQTHQKLNTISVSLQAKWLCGLSRNKAHGTISSLLWLLLLF